MIDRTRLWVVGGVMVGSAIAAGSTLVGCSGDDTVVPDASVVDATPDKTVPDVITTDVVGQDVVDAGKPDNFSTDAAAIYEFMDAHISSFCSRYGQCCFGSDASAFDTTKCKNTLANGWDQTLRALNENPEAITGGRIKLDQTAAAACIAGTKTFSCPSIGAPELSQTDIDCYGAIVGTQANGDPCNFSLECNNGYCVANGPDAGTDAGTGTCTAFKASGQGPCTPRNEECQRRGYVGAPARCDIQKAPDGGPAPNVCTTRLPNGSACTINWECTSGTCDFVTTKCATATTTVTPFICGLFTIQDAGGGG